MDRAVAWSLVLVALGGCRHLHFERNAPGHIDPSVPPSELRAQEVERPRDPGERMVVVSAGGFAGAGGTWDAVGGQLATTTGAELSVYFGHRETSHLGDDWLIYPREAWGVNAGWVPIGRGEVGLRGGYLEAQYSQQGAGAAVGYGRAPGSGHHGPQVTGFYGPLFVRANYFVGAGVDLYAGLLFKLPAVFVWSQ